VKGHVKSFDAEDAGDAEEVTIMGLADVYVVPMIRHVDSMLAILILRG
jgi:hypothetical protein